VEQKRPFAFNAPKPEPVKAPARPAYEPARESVSLATRNAVEQRAGGAVRLERQPEPALPAGLAESIRNAEYEAEQDRPALAPALNPQDKLAEERKEIWGPQQRPEQSASRGFFQRMAEVGRALSSRHDENARPQTIDRVQVVKTVQV